MCLSSVLCTAIALNLLRAACMLASTCSPAAAPAVLTTVLLCEQVKRTCYAQSSQIRQIRKKMVEIMTREAASCDLKELVGKFIPESIGACGSALPDSALTQ